jgi:hypothetical protein
MNLLAIGIDSPKAGKGKKVGFLSGVLYLAPYKLSGVNLCPMAEISGCHQVCLNTAGFGSFDRVQMARVKRSQYFLNHETEFINKLILDINNLIQRANKQNLTPIVRLNGTSDILWENKKVFVLKETAKKLEIESGEYENIFRVFPNLQFYDYTKIAGRKTPNNYDLTFSYSGVERYQTQVKRAIADGMRIAVVFRNKNDIPNEFLGMKVVTGDYTDVRHLEPKGIVVSLYAKGKAKTDNTGFVVDNYTINR